MRIRALSDRSRHGTSVRPSRVTLEGNPPLTPSSSCLILENLGRCMRLMRDKDTELNNSEFNVRKPIWCCVSERDPRDDELEIDNWSQECTCGLVTGDSYVGCFTCCSSSCRYGVLGPKMRQNKARALTPCRSASMSSHLVSFPIVPVPLRSMMLEKT